MKVRIIVQCGIKINNEYWFAAGNTNGLFKKNLLTGEMLFIGFFPGVEKTQFRAYTSVKLVNNKLIFTPCFAKKIAIYSLDENKFSDIELPDFLSGENQYITSVEYKDCVYFIPFSSSLFIKYSVTKDNIHKLDGWLDLKKKYSDHDTDNLVIDTICTEGQYIYMFTSSRNKVIILDMDTDQLHVENLNISSNEKICSVYKFRGKAWIVTDKNRIYTWNYINNEIALVFDFAQYISCVEYFTHYIYVFDKYVYLINVYNKDIRIWDYANDEFIVIDMSKYVSDKSDNSPSLYYYYDIKKVGKNKIQLFSYYDGKYITIDGNSVTKHHEEFIFDEKYLKICFSGEVISENMPIYSGLSLSEEIGAIFIQDIDVQNENYQKRGIGQTIYDLIRAKI